MSRADKAKELFMQGYACSQAVGLAFLDDLSMDKQTLTKILLPFGGGVGRLRLTCGAVSGMAAIIGLFFANDVVSPENKKETYAIVQNLCAKFKEENGSLICAELLQGVHVPVEVGGVAEARTESYYKKRPCSDIVYIATKIVEDYLIETGKIN